MLNIGADNRSTPNSNLLYFPGHEFSRCGSLRSPPEGTLTWVLTPTRTSFPIYPVPETDYRHRCLSLTLAYLSCSPNNLLAKSCFAMQPFLSVSPVYDLDCLLDSESPPPAYFNPICLVYCFPRVFATSPDLKPELWLWFCLAYVVFEACVWTLPVWLAFRINKAKHGSSRPWLCVAYSSLVIVWGPIYGICPQITKTACLDNINNTSYL